MNFFQLMDKLEGLYYKHEGQKFTPTQVTSLLKRSIPFKDVTFYTVKTISQSSGVINVSGLYDPNEDAEGYPPIEIELTYFKRKDDFTFGASGMSFKKWQSLCFDVVSILGHEYLHLHQHRARNFKMGRRFVSPMENTDLKELQEYLGHPDEVDAYAFTIAADMSMKLRAKELVDLRNTAMYIHYREFFGEDHSIVAKLEKRSIKYYNILEGQYYEQQNKNRSRARNR